MPTFDFTAPDGKAYSVDGPDGATPEQAFKILQQHLGNDQPQVGIGADLAKSAASIPGRVAASVLGLPADIAHLYAPNSSDPNPLGSEALKKDFRSDYQAQRLPGQLTQTAGDFLPAMVGGPETLAMKLATRVAAPAIATEAAGAVTDNPWVKAGAGLVGMAGATKAARDFQAMAAARVGEKALPPGEQLLQSGSSGFDKGREMNPVVKPDFATNTASDMREAVKGYDPEAIKLVHGPIDRLENLAKSAPGLPATAVEMNDVENVRKQLSELKTNADASIRSAAKKAQEALTRNQMKLTAADTLSGDAPLYAQTMKNAVLDYGAGKRAATLQGKMNLAELNHGTPVGLLDNASKGQAIQRTMKQLARPINNTNVPVATKLGFNNDEVTGIKNVALGNNWTHAGEYLDRLLPAKLGAIPAAIARQIGGLSINRQVKALDSLVRSRSALAAQVASQMPPEVVQQLPAKTQRILQAISVANRASGSQIPNQIGQAISQPSPQ